MPDSIVTKTYQYKDRKFELIIKEGTPKLTVTPNRITLKLPPHFPKTDISRIEKWSLLIADKIPLNYPSVRGQFKGIRIGLQSDNKKVQKTFYFEDLDKEIKTDD